MDARQLVLDVVKELRQQERVHTLRELWGLLGPTRKKRLFAPENEENYFHQYILPELGHHTSATLRKSAIEAMLGQWKETRAPETLNKIRNAGRRLLRDAQAEGLWNAPNHFDLVKPFRVPQRKGNVLTPEQAAWVLWCTPERWRPLFEVAMRLGPRKGELFALHVDEVDTDRWLISFVRSHGRTTTKTGRLRENIPVPEGLQPWLAEALKRTSCELVFPGPDGKRFRPDFKMTRVLRSVLAQARVVSGYDYICRRKGCGHRERHKTEQPLWCKECGFRLWMNPIPRALRFHDLRHTAANLMEEAGVNAAVRSEVLGHAQKGTTERWYLHTREGFMRAELNKLRLDAKPPPHFEGGKAETIPERRKGFEPSTPSLGSSGPEVKAEAEQARVLEGLPTDHLLTVGEVAQALAISHKKVYQLAEDGVLATVHVGSAIRFRLSVLESFIEGGGTRL